MNISHPDEANILIEFIIIIIIHNIMCVRIVAIETVVTFRATPRFSNTIKKMSVKYFECNL